MVCIAGKLFAARVDTIEIYSNSMHKAIKTVVVTPNLKKSVRYPVVYLLHGAGGSYCNWIQKVPHIQQLADQYKMMIEYFFF